MISEHTINEWLAAYGADQGISLNLNHGQCALVDPSEREALVVELPPAGNIALLHCQLHALPKNGGSELLRTLLGMNFNIDAMRGCWVALDEQQTLRLCYQQPLYGLEQSVFISTLEGFIQQGIEVRDYLQQKLM